MKKRLVITITLVVVMFSSLWAFFNFGGKQSQDLSEQYRVVLQVEDKRLTKGDENAPVKIVEYADILCPYCAKANEEVIPQIEANYIDTKKVHYEVRLVAMITPDSQRAAEGAYCAAEQNKFWDYLDTAYRDTWRNYYSINKSPTDVTLFTEKGIQGFASEVGVDTLLWNGCMESGKYAKTIDANEATMNKIEAYGTPHFVINGHNYNGAPPYATFKAVIDSELSTLVK